MNPTHSTLPSPRDVLGLLVRYRRRWLLPAAVIGLAAVVYAAVRPNTWEAAQALIVRNEAATSDTAPGKFRQPEDMKTVQETILELARSRSVLEAALAEVGPPARSAGASAAWPGEEDIDQLREAVKVAPPKGAEFGKTEVFYLRVRDHDRDRAIGLSRAICDQLEARFQALRDAKAQSMIRELEKTVELARTDLAESTERLTATETQVGSDLGELRSLEDTSSGDGTLRRTTGEIRAELRQVRTALQSNRQLLALLRESSYDPGRLLAAPSQLLDAQPSLRRLKEGLIDAQLRTAALMGNRLEEHPLVRAARSSEEEISHDLSAELAIAIRGVEADVQLDAQREELLEKQLAEANGRLEKLAALRAAYTNQLAENAHRTSLVERAEQNLAEARASLAGAKAASLIGRIDAPETGTRPVGPGRALTALVGMAGGLLAGLGVWFLSLPSPAAMVPQPEPKPAGQNGRPVKERRGVTAAAASTAVPAATGEGNLTFKRALERLSYGSRA